MYCCFVLFYVLFVCKCVLPPGDNPIAVNKYIIYHIIAIDLDPLPVSPARLTVVEPALFE